MKTKPEHSKIVSALQVDRRGFLAGVSVAFSGVPLQALGSTPTVVHAKHKPQRAVFQQQMYFNVDGNGDTYDAPQGNQSTRAYVESISQEEFLKRHWFC